MERVDREDKTVTEETFQKAKTNYYEDEKTIISLVLQRPALGKEVRSNSKSETKSNRTSSNTPPNRTPPPTQNPRIRLFSPLTNATTFIVSDTLIYVPLLLTYTAALPCENKK